MMLWSAHEMISRILFSFPDTLILSQPRGADSAHHCRGRSYHSPVVTSLLLQADWSCWLWSEFRIGNFVSHELLRTIIQSFLKPLRIFFSLSGSRSSSKRNSLLENIHSMNLRMAQITTNITGNPIDVLGLLLIIHNTTMFKSWMHVNKWTLDKGTYFKYT